MKSTEVHRFYCTQCGCEGIPIVRDQGKKRETKHLKKLFCVPCDQQTNHCEISPTGVYQYENFRKDFLAGKFKDTRR